MKGYYFYPTVANTKIPIKGSHGYKSATDREEDLADWLSSGYNVGLSLAQSGLMVLDLDRHSIDGKQSLLELKRKGYELPETYCEATPNNGVHFFFRFHGKPKRRQAVMPGIDLLADFTMVFPSVIDGKPYKPLDHKRIEQDVAPAPRWLLKLLNERKPVDVTSFVSKKTYTSRLLTDIVVGSQQGERNQHLTKLCGSFFAIGCSPEVSYNMLLFANENNAIPLERKEVDAVFNSVLHRHAEKIRQKGGK